MKPRKEYKPKGFQGAKEKLYYKEGADSSSQDKDYWNLSKNQFKKPKFFSKKKEKNQSPEEKREKSRKIKSFLSFFLLGSFLFFIFSVGLAVYMFLSGSIFVSPDNIIVDIEGEKLVSSGDSVNLKITVHNQNKVNLRDVELILRYPEGARNLEDVSSRMLTKRIEVGDLRANEIGRFETSFNLFGIEGESHIFVADLKYTVEGSGAEYQPRKEFAIKIEENPVVLKLIGPDSVYLNGVNEYKIVVQSDSDNVFNNLVVRVDYPVSFYLFESDDELQSGIWNIETLEPGETKELDFKGIFRDSLPDKESRTVSVHIGPADDVATRMDSDEILADIDSVPFEIDVVLDKGDHVYFGETVQGELFWHNRVGLNVEKAYLEFIIEGESVNDFNGDSSLKREDRLIWTEKDFDFSKPRGVIPLNFSTELNRRTIDRDLKLTAVFEGETLDGERVESSYSESFVIATTFDLAIKNKFSDSQRDDVFEAGEITTLESNFNVYVGVDSVDEFKITGKFPSYVTVTDVSVGDENFELKEDGQFEWNLGRVEPGTGLWKLFNPKRREIDLKIRVKHQEDSEGPIFIEELKMTGEDTGTRNFLEKTFYNISIFGKENNLPK